MSSFFKHLLFEMSAFYKHLLFEISAFYKQLFLLEQAFFHVNLRFSRLIMILQKRSNLIQFSDSSDTMIYFIDSIAIWIEGCRRRTFFPHATKKNHAMNKSLEGCSGRRTLQKYWFSSTFRRPRIHRKINQVLHWFWTIHVGAFCIKLAALCRHRSWHRFLMDFLVFLIHLIM